MYTINANMPDKDIVIIVLLWDIDALLHGLSIAVLLWHIAFNREVKYLPIKHSLPFHTEVFKLNIYSVILLMYLF